MTINPLSQNNPLGDQAAQGADSGIKANETLTRLSDKVQDIKDQAAPALNRVASQAEALARRSMDAMRESSQQLRDKATRASDSTIGYIKDEPLKAILIAAATGAALMALISLMTRSRHHD